MTPNVAEAAFFFLSLARSWTEAVLEKNHACANAFENINSLQSHFKFSLCAQHGALVKLVTGGCRITLTRSTLCFLRDRTSTK